MAKYSFEFKLKLVQEYLSGEGGYTSLCEKYHIARSPLLRWVASYRSLGVEGLKRKRKNKAYSPQFKLNAVNLYLTSEKSYQELATELKMSNPSLVTRWVQDYRKKGEFAFF